MPKWHLNIKSFSHRYHFIWASQMMLVVKNPLVNAADVRDAGSIPGLGRTPEEGNGYPLQYSCLGNPMNRGVWRALAHRIAKSHTWLKGLNSRYFICIISVERNCTVEWISFKTDLKIIGILHIHVNELLDFPYFFMDFYHFNLVYPSRKLGISKIKFEHTKLGNYLIRNLLIIKNGIWQI